MWSTRIGEPFARSPCTIWMMQPGFAVTTASAPVARTCAIFRAGRREGLDGARGQGERGVVLARVGVERPAAGLRPRRDHLDSVPGEDTRGRLVLGAEGHLLDATGEQAHPGAPDAGGRRHLG